MRFPGSPPAGPSPLPSCTGAPGAVSLPQPRERRALPSLTLARVAPGPRRHREVRRRRVGKRVVVRVRVRVRVRLPRAVVQQRVHVHVLVGVRRHLQTAAVRWRWRRRQARGAPGQAALQLERLQLQGAQVLLPQSLLLAPFEAAAQEATEAAEQDDETPDEPEAGEAREERVGALGHHHGGGAGGGPRLLQWTRGSSAWPRARATLPAAALPAAASFTRRPAAGGCPRRGSSRARAGGGQLRRHPLLPMAPAGARGRASPAATRDLRGKTPGAG